MSNGYELNKVTDPATVDKLTQNFLVDTNCITYYRDDNTPVAIHGRLPNGEYGTKVAATKRRVFSLDNVIRFIYYSPEQIKKSLGL